MAFLFGRSKKSPSELVKSTVTLLESVQNETEEKIPPKTLSKISTNLNVMKFTLYGDGETDPKKENVDALCAKLFETDLLLMLLKDLKKLEFEARKDVAQIWNYVLRQKTHVRTAIDYVLKNSEILTILVDGYQDGDTALTCGSILREAIRHQALADIVLTSPKLFNPFFDYVQQTTFDIASDAFATFKLLLTKHKNVCATFLESNFDSVFEKYEHLLLSDNYVTKRQSLKLLGELLLDRANFKIMMRYINDPRNLKVMMNLLRGTTKAIQFEAFHVFKIFVANPQKSEAIVVILDRNKEKLIQFLQRFHTEKEDEQFNEEKRILLQALENLQKPE